MVDISLYLLWFINQRLHHWGGTSCLSSPGWRRLMATSAKNATPGGLFSVYSDFRIDFGVENGG